MNPINQQVTRFWELISQLEHYNQKAWAAGMYTESAKSGTTDVDVQELHSAVAELERLFQDRPFVEWMKGFRCPF